jgi:hypothetical protein
MFKNTLYFLVGMSLFGCTHAVQSVCQPQLIDIDSVAFFKNEIARETFEEVKVDQISLALKLIANQSVLEIELDKQKIFAPKLLLKFNGGWRYFLVKAKRVTGGGGFNAFLLNEQVLVLHTDLGKSHCSEIFETMIVIASQKSITSAISGASTAE